MKSFRTGSANVVTDCQQQFNLYRLYSSHLTDIRTTKFLEKLTSSEILFALFLPNRLQLICIFFSKYDHYIKSSKQSTDIIEYTFFCV